ncbi:hypothetical protein [Kribbella catacumbae]|uniref:hypothetical protein n=1 Tax=Kribbella catacumbae TaxID=460086 RepID=UPI00037EB112|nr:hypothetical protein [Kribbella catacumbae]
MEDDEQELRDLLHQYDEAGGLEHPPFYNHRKTRAAFNALVDRLDADFATSCRADRDVQDASLHGRIEIPVEALHARTPPHHPGQAGGAAQIVVSVSNFGSMAVISAENPGAYLDLTEALADDAITGPDLKTVRRALDELGYRVIPEELLTRPYDGISELGYPPDRQPDWWIRFFDYL